MSREEFHQSLMKAQKELHERAIRGDFEPEKLKKMDIKAEVENGWDRIHPGSDDDDEDD